MAEKSRLLTDRNNAFQFIRGTLFRATIEAQNQQPSQALDDHPSLN
ncbi:hypothetical protein I603_2257 [Erythrobacter dokdonensis DSW-74]|uniref:Uncharacterized protein n=1 Tax=Erythrobacter dokdonensis DSW-74 TaxID=1300349 RepID=A0A1A7BGF7_9SPHN|nr:hypothetical protein I603_2257 [Erythrobacter dokdonensis DSW-74]